jgi:hypothetical protein
MPAERQNHGQNAEHGHNPGESAGYHLAPPDDEHSAIVQIAPS